MRMCTVDFKERVCTGKAGGVERALQKTRMRTLSLRRGGGCSGKRGRGPQSCRAGTSSWRRGGCGCRELRPRDRISVSEHLLVGAPGGTGLWGPKEGEDQLVGRTRDTTFSGLST